jgi:hypothetical protein
LREEREARKLARRPKVKTTNLQLGDDNGQVTGATK